MLAMAIPLTLSTGSWSILHFVDRMFLTWYSPETIAAVMPSGMFNFATMSIFIGTASYAGIFVAQYYGSGCMEKIGPSVWQGVYVALIGGVVHLLFIPLAAPFFRFVGHEALVQRYEVEFYQILCLGAFPSLASSAFSAFFTGMRKPWYVVWVNLIATSINIILDYILIFGRYGFPEMGIRGAATATVIAGCSYFIMYLILLSRPSYNKIYNTLKGWRIDGGIFIRLLRYGFPSGVQFFIDMAGFTIFILFVGRLGITELAATNIAFNINTLAFMPMIGFSISVSVLVGLYQGKRLPAIGERSVYSGFHLTFLYMTGISLLYVFFPDLFIRPFAAKADPSSFAEIWKISTVLLRFVAVYSLFDTLNIVFASALKGAGDTRYVMFMIIFVSVIILVIPSYLAIIVFKDGLYVAWFIASAYVVILGLSFLLRFLNGKWKGMTVIEENVPCIPTSMPEAPVVEL